MKKRVWFIVLCLIVAAIPAPSENYLLKGDQQAVIQLHMVQTVVPPNTAQKLVLSFVKPVSYASPTYNQAVDRFYINYSLAPNKEENRTDVHGNSVIEAVWETPPATLVTAIDLAVNTSVRLDPLKTTAPFPVADPPPEAGAYLAATAQVSSNDPAIQAKARELTAGAANQFDAVNRIAGWVVDHMRYIQNPEQYDARYALRTGKGNCQNYSHLSAALMRAAGIPVRIVSGVTLKQPYEIRQDSGALVIKDAQAHCVWIEVWFPDLSWVPFDPLCTEMFVSNRYIRTAVGLDASDLETDGLILWSLAKPSPGKLSCTEDIGAEFVSDNVKITSRAAGYGPRNRLLSPEVVAEFKKPALAAAEPEPVALTADQMQPLKYVRPFLSGNLEFPENLDFASVREPIRPAGNGVMMTARSFMEETAEYVTTQNNKYAQPLVLDEPVKVRSIGLALRNFSTAGQIWIELLKDNNGLPDQRIATSDTLSSDGIDRAAGYRWVDFSFAGQEIPLSPGRYWIALGFSGGPIINWFFTYGNPTGPRSDARLQTLFDKKWGARLACEFNYRIQGTAADKPANQK